MSKLLSQLYRDERGYVAVTEWMLMASLLTLGSLAALLAVHAQ